MNQDIYTQFCARQMIDVLEVAPLGDLAGTRNH